MYLSDFIYRDTKLSDYGCVIAYIVTGSDESASLGSVISQTNYKNNSTYRKELVSATYDEVVTATFDIIKNPCEFNNNMAFTDNEISSIMRWLNSITNEQFIPIYDDDNYPSVYFDGSFTTVNAIVEAGQVIGFTLTFTADMPFAKELPTVLHYELSGTNASFKVFNDSDDLGYLYPTKVTVELTSAGKFVLTNNLDSRITIIDNCVAGEKITMDCEHKIISSSETHAKLANDFNYNFPRLVATWDKKENVLTSSLPCTIEITYAPIRKVGIIV